MSTKVSSDLGQKIKAVDAATAGLEADLKAARSEVVDTKESREAYIAERLQLLDDISYNHALRERLMTKLQRQLEQESN